MPVADQPAPNTDSAELRDLLDRGHDGDATALPEICAALDGDSELAATIGDVEGLALEAMLGTVAGRSLTTREAIRCQTDRLRAELAGPDAPALQRLLADRVVLTRVEVCHADTALASALRQNPADAPEVRAAERRARAAQARHLAAIRTLAAVRKLAEPRPSRPDAVKAETEVSASDRIRVRAAGRSGRVTLRA